MLVPFVELIQAPVPMFVVIILLGVVAALIKEEEEGPADAMSISRGSMVVMSDDANVGADVDESSMVLVVGSRDTDADESSCIESRCGRDLVVSQQT